MKKLAFFIIFFLSVTYSVDATDISGNITSSTNWTEANSPYNLSGTVTVNSGVTLIIDPGVTINFANNASLQVNGILKSEGTSSKRITFNGTAKTGRISLNNSSGNIISQSQISGLDYGIYVNNCSPLIKNNIVELNNTGIYVYQGSPDIRNNIILNNYSDGIYIYSYATGTYEFNTIYKNGNFGINYNSSTNLVIKNSIITRNSTGIYDGGGGICTSQYNDVWDNLTNYYNASASNDISTDPMFTDELNWDFTLKSDSPAKTASQTASEIGAYGDSGIPLSTTRSYSTSQTKSGTLNKDEKWSGTITLTGNVTVPKALNLVIEPGTIVNFELNNVLEVDGIFHAVGTTSERISFKGKSKTGRIKLVGAGGSTISYSEISGFDHGIYIDNSIPVIKNNTIQLNSTGIYVYQGKPDIKNNIILNNSDGIYIYSYVSGGTYEYNTIYKNSNCGISYNSSTNLLIKNSIIARNTYGIYDGGGGICSSDYNDIWDNVTNYYNASVGTNDITTDPMFIDELSWNFNLKSDSPAKTASSSTSEIGAFGNSGNPPTVTRSYSTTPTTSGTFTQDEKWSGTVTLTGSVTVPKIFNLIIDPGTKVNLGSNMVLEVNGILHAKGTSSDRITFDGTSKTGRIRLNSAGGSTISYCEILDLEHGIYIDNSIPVIKNNTIQLNNTGIYVYQGKPDIKNNVILNNYDGIYIYSYVTGGIYEYNTIYKNSNCGINYNSSTNLNIKNSIVVRNTYGIYDGGGGICTSQYNDVWDNITDYYNASKSTGDITENPLFMDELNWDFKLQAISTLKTASETEGEIGAFGNYGEPPTVTRIYSTTPTTSGTLTQDEKWSGAVTLTGSVTVPKVYNLIIEPGTKVNLNLNVVLTTEGILHAQGTSSNRITFDGTSKTGRIRLNSAGGSTISYSEILDLEHGIYIDNSIPVIKNNTIQLNNTGIYVYQGKPDIRNNIIINNNDGIYIYSYTTGGIYEYNTIYKNTDCGINYNSSTNLIIKNSIIVRNNTGIYDGGGGICTSQYNDVWDNITNYYNASKSTGDITTNPMFQDELNWNFALKFDSPVKTASSGGTEIGAYGDSGTPPTVTRTYSNTPTTSGTLSKDEKWSGTVTLTGTITVPKVFNIIIEPGTIVNLASDVVIHVYGILHAAGTSSNKIKFNGTSKTGRIQLEGAGGSTISYSEISGLNNGIYIKQSIPVIKNNVIKLNTTGVYVYQGSPSIINNIIENNNENGIYIYSYASGGTYDFNTVKNSNYGINFSSSSNMTFKNSIIVENTYGIYDGGGGIATSQYNNVWNNTTNYYNVSVGTGAISNDPIFADAEYHISSSSTCKTASECGREIGRYGTCASQPTADFTSDPTTGVAPLTVNFTDKSTGEIDSWSWDFGDGESSTQQNPTHIYNSNGKYTVTLNISGIGGSNSKTNTNYIIVTYSKAEDFFNNASIINSNTNSIRITGSNLDTTKETGEPNHAGNAGGKSVWWKWLAPFTTKVSLDTHGSDFDTLLAVYKGKSLDKLTNIASNDDDGSSKGNSGLIFYAEIGRTYYFAVDGKDGATGNIILNFNAREGNLCVDFGSLGLWVYNGTKWIQIAKNNPYVLKTYSYDEKIVGKFSDHLYEYDGKVWTKIATTLSEDMIGVGSNLYVDFGTNGVYKYDGKWTKVTTSNPTAFATYDDKLIGKFSGYLYEYDGNVWTKIATTPSESMIGIDSELYVDFGDKGVYKYNKTWTQVAKNNPANITSYNSKLVGKFSGQLYEYDGQIWTKIATTLSEDMIGIGSELYVDFGDKGVYKYSTIWERIATNTPDILFTYNGKLVGKFTGYLHENTDGRLWKRIATTPSEDMIAINFAP
ncbi:MAG: right-handed parallel beta-helix repeat-containing protein [Desulfobacterales bacterium]|nr:right-handed parallel beta-helix repeat-containing protein [Desulfobacterales bacterium]MBF0395526.1 right-handed parallel beta-helix repeat-containing protein [Desulfobacterales bacterium]